MINTRRSAQSGAILVFFALILVVLLGFVALVIDTGIGESGRGEEETAVQNASLAAMSAYLEAFKTPSNDLPAQAQRAQGAAVSNAEAVIGASNRISTHYRQTPSSQTDLSETDDNGPGRITFGRMVWSIPTPINGGDPSPDAAPCNNKVPCFRPLPAQQGNPPELATALEIKTHPSNNPIQTLFGRFFGITRYELGATAISTLIPQNYLFLVDLSPSTVDQSYRRVGTRDIKCIPSGAESRCTDSNWVSLPSCFLPASAWYFAYDVDSARADANGCGPGSVGTCACLSALDTADNCLAYPRIAHNDGSEDYLAEEIGVVNSVDAERRRARRIFAGYTSWWNDAGSAAERARFPVKCQPKTDVRSQCPMPGMSSPLPAQCEPLVLPPDSSFRSDYRVVQNKFGTDIVAHSGTSDVSYSLVDFGQSNGSSMSFEARPEPLRSIFEATNSAMDYIKRRAVSADKFMLAGFDETILSARSTCKTGSMDECADGDTLVAPSSASFNGFLNLTNVTSWTGYSAGDNYHFLNRGFFPRQGYNTDIQLALWKAYQELAASPTTASAKNLVFLITDGVANCKVPANPLGDVHFGALTDYIALRQCDGQLSTVGRTVIEAVRQMSAGLRNSEGKTLVQLLKEKHIAVSVILIGQNVFPHSLVRPSTTPGRQGGCLTNSEAVYGKIPFVDWVTSSSGAPYTCKNGTSNCTGGFRLDLLSNDAKALIDPNATVRFPVANLLYEELVAPTQGAWIPIMEPLLSAGGVPVNFADELTDQCNRFPRDDNAPDEERVPIMPNISLEHSAGGEGSKVTDGFGRLLYDPYGRSPRDQIIEQVKQVLGGGFVLVEPAVRATE